MKKYLKHIRFQNIVLNVEKAHPKQISRVIFTLHQENGTSHKTKKYGDVDSTSIRWNSPVEFLYTAQPSFKFQTTCEHQFGYQIQDLKALYKGVINIRPQDFFHVNRFTVYNNHGQQCGRLSAMIKVVDRQVGVKYNQEEQIGNKQHIRVDLVGKITFYSARLVINSHNAIHYEHKNRKLKLILQVDTKIINGASRQDYKWSLNDTKIQIYQSTAKIFPIKIEQNGSVLLQGKLQMETIINNKRFLTQTVQLTNIKNQKIGALQVDMRYVTKKQILDLMYSPSKLQGIKMQKIQTNGISYLNEKISSGQQSIPLLNKKKTQTLLKKKKSYSTDENHKSMQISISPFKKSRIQLYMKQKHMLNQNISKLPHDERFKEIKPNNPYISYMGQQQFSDFSPKRKNRGASITTTEKYDFTRRYKGNPGVGDYHLPSIFDK